MKTLCSTRDDIAMLHSQFADSSILLNKKPQSLSVHTCARMRDTARCPCCRRQRACCLAASPREVAGKRWGTCSTLRPQRELRITAFLIKNVIFCSLTGACHLFVARSFSQARSADPAASRKISALADDSVSGQHVQRHRAGCLCHAVFCVSNVTAERDALASIG
jgi:hypothetical protein